MNRSTSIYTGHGNLRTPFFMPDATRGLVKLLTSSELEKSGTEAIVVNTYHLLLQPGVNIINKMGGIHKFINWDRPILSDSGGFQIFSLIHSHPGMGKIEDDKVIFKSPLNGQEITFTPEKSIQIQFNLDVDMMVCLDDCPRNNVNSQDLKKSVQRTILWAQKCRSEYDKQIKKRGIKENERPLLFAVIQGGKDRNMREYCAKELIDIGFDGYGFGAMPTDSQGKFNTKLLHYTANLIPDNGLKFCLGVGNPEDIVKSSQMGWDMFDCIIPTREGRHGKLFEFTGKPLASKDFYRSLNIKNNKFTMDSNSINNMSEIKNLQEYTRSYLHHLFKIKDSLGYRLASLNNLEFYNNIIKEIRDNN